MTEPLPLDVVADLRNLLGDRLILAHADRWRHGASESHFDAVAPDAVVYPLSTADVVKVVRICVPARIPLIPYGAGTSLEGHVTPVRGGVTVDLTRMDAILEINPGDFDCTVQAGVRRETLNAHLRDQGLFFPVDPGANATLGGMTSTRASGTTTVRYGAMRELVLSLRVVTPDGRDIRTGARARKSSAGYDLTHLMMGAEGTLGIITEITLRLQPIPEAIAAAVCGFVTLAGAVDTVVDCLRAGIPLARVEILDDVQMRAVNRWANLDYPEVTTLFFEFHGTESGVADQANQAADIANSHGGGAFAWARRPEERSRLWRARHEAYYAALGLRPGCVGWPTDVCVPMSCLAECIAQTKRDLVAPILGHVGDGNFHVIFVIDPGNPAEMVEAERLNARLIERALAMGGTCTGEHGVGLGKQNWLLSELGDAVDVMRSIKRALDPQDLFNPGKIFTL